MKPFLRRAIASVTTLVFLLTGMLGLSATAFVQNVSAASAYTTLAQSYIAAPASATPMGQHATSDPLTITLALQPGNSSSLTSLVNALYNPQSRQYHQWLAKGQFNKEFAPAASQVTQVQNYLRNAGLKLLSSPSPFLLRAQGTTGQIQTAFRTTINNYRARNGQTFFQNDTAVSIPTSLSSIVLAVSGLSNTSAAHPNYVTTHQAAQASGKAVPQYGAGPDGSGLTPSQTSSLYDATPVYQLGNKGEGKGATLAVFELSGYTPADVVTYEHQFFGKSENVPLVDVNVDGGPVTPVCPVGDECGPFTAGPPCANGCDSADYSGDIEVEADLENQIAIAPKISKILVYNAPNDELGITTTDEYFQIANDDIADSISSSWGLCESDAGFADAQGEYFAFLQMALQGQSIFSASGDTGAYDCLRGSGTTNLSVDDPSSQPFVTGVGGTSFESYDPGSSQHPSYPKSGETVWNVLDACSGSASGLSNCANLGAGGGGVSTFWGQPSYQYGPGVISSLSQKAPYCKIAAKGQYCREVPDVSADADEYTPYAEYCTGDPATNSFCASFGGGWFGIGGTSLSSPLWSGIIALWDSVHGQRFGSANYGLYDLYRLNETYSTYFHDVTGVHQTENNNGYYPTTPNYDMATGIGTPRIAGIVEHKF
jgi:kumamolisin